MPEGDTIHYAANRIRPVLAGHVPEELRTPHPRFGRARWETRLAGRTVEAVEAHGKHLFLRFEGGLTIHSHLRMTGSWRVLDGARAPSHSAWLVIRRDDRQVVQFKGPVLELMTDSRTRFDGRLAALGPDVLAPALDEAGFLRRLREDDQSRGIGDALLDQRNLAGVGNVWKSEACHAVGIDPWRPLARVSDAEALAAVRAVRPRMLESVEAGGHPHGLAVYGRAGETCPRCGGRIRARGQGDDNRTTYWCPACQG